MRRLQLDARLLIDASGRANASVIPLAIENNSGLSRYVTQYWVCGVVLRWAGETSITNNFKEWNMRILNASQPAPGMAPSMRFEAARTLAFSLATG